MRVAEIMKRDVATCTPMDDLATVAGTMQRHKCGFVPVVDSHGGLVGVVTDRDLCLAAAAERHRTAEHIGVKDTMSRPVFSCSPDENLEGVLTTMAQHHVRRLPVVDANGHLQGVLSVDDMVQVVGRPDAPSADQIVDALKRIAAPRPIGSPVA